MKEIAFCYDFDGTLAPGNMQEHDFIPKQLGMKNKDFWKEVKAQAEKEDMDEILSYMEMTLRKAKEKKIEFNKKAFKGYGKKIRLFPGLTGENNWFDRLNEYGKGKKLKVEHYVISSGLKPMIEGCKIPKRTFNHIFACDFIYDQHEVASFPATVINYTTKTQCLFRINKGILNNWNNDDLNKYFEKSERPVPFNRIVYFGDGLTDVPAMKMTKANGGFSVAVFQKGKKNARSKCQAMLQQERCSYIGAADYSKESDLDKISRFIIDKVSAELSLSAINKNTH